MFHVVDMLKVLTDGILGNSFYGCRQYVQIMSEKTINNILSMFRWIKCSLNQVVNDTWTLRSVYELKGRFLTHYKDIDCKILDIYKQISQWNFPGWLLTLQRLFVCIKFSDISCLHLQIKPFINYELVCVNVQNRNLNRIKTLMWILDVFFWVLWNKSCWPSDSTVLRTKSWKHPETFLLIRLY